MKAQILSVFPILLQRPLLFKPPQSILESIAQHFKVSHATIDFGPSGSFLQHVSEILFGFFKPFSTREIDAITSCPTRGIRSADETSFYDVEQFARQFVAALIDIAVDQADLQDFVLRVKRQRELESLFSLSEKPCAHRGFADFGINAPVRRVILQ